MNSAPAVSTQTSPVWSTTRIGALFSPSFTVTRENRSAGTMPPPEGSRRRRLMARSSTSEASSPLPWLIWGIALQLLFGVVVLSPQLQDFFFDIGMPMLQGYGLTEASGNNFWLPRERIGDKPTSVGAPIFHIDMKVVDESGQEMPNGEAGELLIRVKYCGICGTDLHIYADEFPNAPPVVMGHEYCGTVVQVGESVRDTWSVAGQRTSHGSCSVSCSVAPVRVS